MLLLELHALTLAARSYALLVGGIAIWTNGGFKCVCTLSTLLIAVQGLVSDWPQD